MILNNKAVLNVPDFSGVAGVSSFNSRLGDVEPQLGDYTAQMVGAIPKPIDDGERRVIIGDSLVIEPQGVMTFNGRHGYVVPEENDYTAEMVGAIPTPDADGLRRVVIGDELQLEEKVLVIDNLASTSPDSALSAKQGKALNDTKQNNITGAASTITSSNLTADRILAADTNGKVAISNVTSAELDLIKDRTTRFKSELDFTGLDIELNSGVTYNLVTLLKGITPTIGSWAPFFDTTTDKMVVVKNDDRSLKYKIAITGSFGGAAPANSLELTVNAGVNIDTLTVVRISGQASQTINYNSFISVDKNGNFATNGGTLELVSSTSNFTITRVRIIAEQ